jgi:hypothetical protein
LGLKGLVVVVVVDSLVQMKHKKMILLGETQNGTWRDPNDGAEFF